MATPPGSPRDPAGFAPTSHGGNHFNLLRLMAAVAVLLSHGEYFYRLTLPVPFAGHTLGSLAVYCFFFISGYLVCQSWHREPRWAGFWIKRIARIFPGLVAAVIFSVAVVGWLMTTWSSGRYWAEPATWGYLANNAAALATANALPGVFESNPFARSVNGSLWTIRYELLMYLLLSAAGWAGWTGRRWAYLAGAAAMAALWMWARGFSDTPKAPFASLTWLPAGLGELFNVVDVSAFGVMFLLGSSFAASRVRPGAWLAALACAGLVLAWAGQARWSVQIGVWTLVASGVFWAAHAGASRASGWPREDLSYGVYIYAFPIQQAVTQISLSRGWSLSACLAASLVLTLAMAAFSWFCVEKPGIRLGRRLAARLASARAGPVRRAAC